MKIAVLGESGGDEEFVPVIAQAILEHPIETVSRHLRARGWPSVRQVLPAVFKELFYHSDADGLIVIADSGFSRIHRLSDEPAEASRDGCRACQLRLAVQVAQRHVRSTARPKRLEVAIGLAVPAIEAWYLCGVDGRVTEAAWVSGLNSGPMPYTRAGLKRDLRD